MMTTIKMSEMTLVTCDSEIVTLTKMMSSASMTILRFVGSNIN